MRDATLASPALLRAYDDATAKTRRQFTLIPVGKPIVESLVSDLLLFAEYQTVGAGPGRAGIGELTAVDGSDVTTAVTKFGSGNTHGTA
jgi:hypothetical protein